VLIDEAISESLNATTELQRSSFAMAKNSNFEAMRQGFNVPIHRSENSQV
jgi:hypothetical protein